MAQGKKDTRVSTKALKSSKSVELAKRGVHTGADFAGLMSALLSDTIAGRVDPRVSNAACNVGGKLLKCVEMQFRYGKKGNGINDRMLALTSLAGPAR